MANEDPPSSADNERPSSVQLTRSFQNTLFYGDRGLRSGWRIVAFSVLVLIFSTALNLALSKIFHTAKTYTPGPGQIFLQEFLLFILVFLPACFMAWLEHRSVGAYGLPIRSLFGMRFWQGCALGGVEIVVLMGGIAAFGGYSFG
ncbi:MAG TPA: hypothetical protein VM781_01895, partial [Candidatus Bathyarchaeia archaeon]|nr:hypothetical protein [Candidatus Bathyarchaeia archaeon]